MDLQIDVAAVKKVERALDKVALQATAKRRSRVKIFRDSRRNMHILREEFRKLLNCASAEIASDTPDYILAEFMTDVLSAFNKAVNQREHFLQRDEEHEVRHMTDLDNLKNILTKAGVVYEISNDLDLNEIELEFQMDWMPEELLFIFDAHGYIKEIH